MNKARLRVKALERNYPSLYVAFLIFSLMTTFAIVSICCIVPIALCGKYNEGTFVLLEFITMPFAAWVVSHVYRIFGGK